jgi:hypothetical protein
MVFHPQLLEHSECRLDRHDRAPASGNWNGNATGSGTNVENMGVCRERGGLPEMAQFVIRYYGAVTPVIHRRVRRKVDALAHVRRAIPSSVVIFVMARQRA